MAIPMRKFDIIPHRFHRRKKMPKKSPFERAPANEKGKHGEPSSWNDPDPERLPGDD